MTGLQPVSIEERGKPVKFLGLKSKSVARGVSSHASIHISPLASILHFSATAMPSVRFVLRSVYALLAVAPSLVGPAAYDETDRLVTLSGCLVRGEHQGYLLTNLDLPDIDLYDIDPTDADNPGRDRIEPGPVGTSGARPSVFYWLNDNDGLVKEIGHHVEIGGKVMGTATKGEMTIHRTANRTDLEITSEGRTLTAQLSESLFTLSPPGPAVVDLTTGTTRVRILVGRVNVERVRRLAPNCH